MEAEDKETFHIFNGSQTLNVKTLNIKNAQVTRSKIIIEFIINLDVFAFTYTEYFADFVLLMIEWFFLNRI